jgi:cytochrome c
VGLGLGVVLAAGSAFAQGSPTHGQQVFQDQCSGCHVLTGQGFSAPPLAGVFGRQAGTADFQYSAAMKKSGIVWDETSLNDFLSDPSKMVPGTAMNFSLSDPQARDDVISYLKTLSPASK